MVRPSTDQLTTQQLSSVDKRASHGSQFSLLIVGDGISSTYPLPAQGRLIIGRARHAELRIDHGSISREHAALRLGADLELEDLGSANGTRVRGVALAPHSPLGILPHDVIDLGRVLLVVQPRGLEQRLHRVCAAPFFDLRVEEERERASNAPFAVAELVVQGELGSQAIELILASELAESDLLTRRAPGLYQLLMLKTEPALAAQRLARVCRLLQDRELSVKERLVCAPRDGASLADLLGTSPGQAPGRQLPAGKFVVASEPMRRVKRLLERVADSELSVLLLGETGVGKEMCAELLHEASRRAAGPLVRLNCAALPENLLESELFGYERGAFTGATTDKPGLLESAHGGTLFLDEVGDMPLTTQVKLLRAVETKQVVRLGSRSPRALDVRIVSATNQDLHERITEGLFREDLYYRLNGISVLVPPLRERREDIDPLLRVFMAGALRAGQAQPRVSSASLSLLQNHPWPGNVRELKNTIQRALVLCDEAVLEPHHFELEARPAVSEATGQNLHEEVKSLERGRIEQALRQSAGNQSRAAELLGISRGALLRRLEQLGLSRPRKGA